MESANTSGPDPALPTVPPVPQPAGQGASVPAQPAAPTMADDGDLIEKAWVAQVKQIVQQTANDPYEQNRQLSKLKADYMQKRYGKLIKLED